jgi:hypothetical protein
MMKKSSMQTAVCCVVIVVRMYAQYVSRSIDPLTTHTPHQTTRTAKGEDAAQRHGEERVRVPLLLRHVAVGYLIGLDEMG